ncbi:MAG: rhodanese-like domain-containing protein [Acidimicrobiia bacterium]|jgi:phage shock protein E
MRRSALIIIALLSVLVAACGGAAVATEPGVRLVDAETAAGLATSDGVVVLDIRTPEEYAAGHIEDSLNIDFYAADFADRIAALDREASYVMYCRSGNRSDAAANLMRDLGFDDVAELDGGVLSWASTGLPLVTGG